MDWGCILVQYDLILMWLYLQRHYFPNEVTFRYTGLGPNVISGDTIQPTTLPNQVMRDKWVNISLSILLTGKVLSYCGSPGGSVVKNLPVMQEIQERQVGCLSREGPLEEEMVTNSSILVWRIPQTEEPWRASLWGWQSQTWLSMHVVWIMTFFFKVLGQGSSFRKAESQRITLPWVWVFGHCCGTPVWALKPRRQNHMQESWGLISPKCLNVNWMTFQLANLGSPSWWENPQPCFSKDLWILPTVVHLRLMLLSTTLKTSCLKNNQGLPGWCNGKESTCQCSGQGFHPWSGKIPQLSLCATATEST